MAYKHTYYQTSESDLGLLQQVPCADQLDYVRQTQKAGSPFIKTDWINAGWIVIVSIHHEDMLKRKGELARERGGAWILKSKG